MTEVAYDLFSDWKKYIHENSDPRTRDWPFMDSPLPFILITVVYLYFVCKAGPQYMKYRKPYNLKTVITIYNTFQILSCIYLIYGLTKSGALSLFKCDQKDYKVDYNRYNVAKLIWWTIMLKLTEYLETVFFVLRKKQNQVSGLHLYHHVSTLSIGWLTCKLAPGMEAVAPIVINSFIHILMYSYYLIALYGGKDLQRKIVFWKRTLTILQMIQFTIIIMHLLSGLSGSCSETLITRLNEKIRRLFFENKSKVVLFSKKTVLKQLNCSSLLTPMMFKLKR